MLKEHRRQRVALGPVHAPSPLIAPRVVLIPGNRFFLLPLKKVSWVIRHHRCHGSSATSTKPCIVRKSTNSSRSALFHVAASTRGATTDDVINAVNGPTKISRQANCSIPLITRGRIKKSHRRVTIVKSCLSPVREQEVNFFVNEPLVDQVYWNLGIQEAHEHYERVQGRSHKTSVRAAQILSEKAKHQHVTNNQYQKAERKPDRRSRLADNNLGREDSVHEQQNHLPQENGRRLETQYIQINLKNNYLPNASPDLSQSRLVVRMDHVRTSKKPPSPAQKKMQIAASLIQRFDVPRSDTGMEALTRNLTESTVNSSKKQPALQQSSQVSGRLSLPLARALSPVNATKFNNSVGERPSHFRLNSTKIHETGRTGQHPNHFKKRLDSNKVEGAEKGTQLDGNHMLHKHYPQNKQVTVLDQCIAQHKSYCDVLEYFEREDLKATFNADNDFGKNIRKVQDGSAIATEKNTRGAKRGHQRSAGRKENLHEKVLRIQTSGKSKVSPSSCPLGPTFQVDSIDHNMLLPRERPTQGFADLERREVTKSNILGRNSSGMTCNMSMNCSANRKRTILKGFLCSLASEDGLPIGPLDGF